jgi:urocanate hydratase
MKIRVRRCSTQAQGAVVFDYGNNIRQVALGRPEERIRFSGFVPAYIRRSSARGSAFRWVALSAIPRTSTAPTRR